MTGEYQIGEPVIIYMRDNFATSGMIFHHGQEYAVQYWGEKYVRYLNDPCETHGILIPMERVIIKGRKP